MIRNTPKPRTAPPQTEPSATGVKADAKAPVDGTAELTAASIPAPLSPFNALREKSEHSPTTLGKPVAPPPALGEPTSHPAGPEQPAADVQVSHAYDDVNATQFFSQIATAFPLNFAGDIWKAKYGLFSAIGDVARHMPPDRWLSFGAWLAKCEHLAASSAAPGGMSHEDDPRLTASFIKAAAVYQGKIEEKYAIQIRTFALQTLEQRRLLGPTPNGKISSSISYYIYDEDVVSRSFVFEALLIEKQLNIPFLSINDSSFLRTILSKDYKSLVCDPSYLGVSDPEARLLTIDRLLHYSKLATSSLPPKLTAVICTRFLADLKDKRIPNSYRITPNAPFDTLEKSCNSFIRHSRILTSSQITQSSLKDLATVCSLVEAEVFHMPCPPFEEVELWASGQLTYLMESVMLESIKQSDTESDQLVYACRYLAMCKRRLVYSTLIFSASDRIVQQFRLKEKATVKFLLEHLINLEVPVKEFLPLVLKKEDPLFNIIFLKSLIAMPLSYSNLDEDLSEPKDLSRAALVAILNSDVLEDFSFFEFRRLHQQFKLDYQETLAIWAKRQGKDVFHYLGAREEADAILTINNGAGPSREQMKENRKHLFDKLELRHSCWLQLTQELERISDDAQHQTATIALSVLAVGLHDNLSPEQLAWVERNGFVSALVNLAAPHLKPAIARATVNLAQSEQSQQGFDARVPLRLERKHGAALLLSQTIQELSALTVDTSALIQALNGPGYRIYKDGPKLVSLLSSLQTLLDSSTIDVAAKRRLAELLLENVKSDVAQLPTRVKRAMLILRAADSSWLSEPGISIDSLAARALALHLGPMDLAEPLARFEETFGASRASFAVIEYLSNLSSLQSPNLTAAARLYVRQVLQGTFAQERMDVAHNPHLALVEQQMPGVLRLWATGSVITAPTARAGAPWDAKVWLKECLLDFGHLPEAAQQMPDLMLQLDPEHHRTAATPRDAAQLITEAEATSWSNLRAACLGLLDSKPQKQSEALRDLALCLTALGGDHEFANDIAAAQRALAKQAAPARKGTFQLIDTADPIHLLLCGTEVPGSCQRIEGNPGLNQGLLGYLLNGQTRLLAVIKEDSKVIEARCLLRLLTDGQRPVLFLERLYGDAAYEPALLDLARNKARALGLKLSAYSPTSRWPTGSQLRSVGGRAPVEYCDGARGVCVGSQFTIEAGEWVDV